MPIATYITFEDQSKDAIAFYEQVFETNCLDLVTYATLGIPDLDEKSQTLVMNASLKIEEHTIMFSDTPSFMNKISYGRNVGLVIEITDPEKLTNYFTKLSIGATHVMPLQKTDWSDLFGQLTDQFGISWSFNLV